MFFAVSHISLIFHNSKNFHAIISIVFVNTCKNNETIFIENRDIMSKIGMNTEIEYNIV